VNNVIRKDELLLSTQGAFNAAEFVLEYLSQINVDKIFGVPGGAIEPLFDAVARFNRDKGQKPAIDLITSRHETGAVFMADGYARESGRLAVCCATTGPGSTNMITGIASAYTDQIPMLVLTPQTSMAGFGRQELQDSSDDSVSVVTMLSRCTRYNSMVTHIDQLKYKLTKAVKRALTYPCGPVHLSIPMDIWHQTVDAELPPVANGMKAQCHDSYEQPNYEKLCQLLSGNHKSLFLLGVDSLPHIRTIIECAEIIGAEIVTTAAAKGAISANHPLYRGVIGFAGHQQATELLYGDETDHIVVIGSNLSPFETAGLSSCDAIMRKVLCVNFPLNDDFVYETAHLQLYGNLEKIFDDLKNYLHKRQVIDRFTHKRSIHSHRCNVIQYGGFSKMGGDGRIPSSTYIDQPDKEALVKPQYLMGKLPGLLPSKSRYHIDAGNSWAWATHYLHLNSVLNYRIAMGFGSMGWAIGAAVGAASAQDEAPAVCITGDGSYLMSGQEITVAVQLQLPVIFVVLNDHAFGMVKHGQRLGGAEAIGFELPPVNFAMMARAVGAVGISVENAQQLDELEIDQLLDTKGPVLLDIHIDPEEVPPMASRMKELGRG